VRPRSISAASTLLYAYMPAAMSAIEQPAVAGAGGVVPRPASPAAAGVPCRLGGSLGIGTSKPQPPRLGHP
jgi:hypothetical protein